MFSTRKKTRLFGGRESKTREEKENERITKPTTINNNKYSLRPITLSFFIHPTSKVKFFYLGHDI